MRRSTHDLVRLIVLLTVSAVLACSWEGSFSASVSFRISANARVFTSQATEQAEVAPDEVTVPVDAVKDLEIKPGVILVSEDFVRRVVTTDSIDGKLVAKTERASLEEVVEQGEPRRNGVQVVSRSRGPSWGLPEARLRGRSLRRHLLHRELPRGGVLRLEEGNNPAPTAAGQVRPRVREGVHVQVQRVRVRRNREVDRSHHGRHCFRCRH